MNIDQATNRNMLLFGLSRADYALLQPHLTRIFMPRLLNFYDAGETISHVYFPEDGIASIVAIEDNGHQIEVGIIGREGMVGAPVILGTECSPHSVYMQIGGNSGLKLKAVQLHDAMQESPTLKALMLRYIQTVLVQTMNSVSALASYTIEQRLARWILMCDDRLEGEIRHTHEFMSVMLGIRRAGVTVAMHDLEVRHLIRPKRGSLVIEDRIGLEAMTGGCYGFAEAEYLRVMGNEIRPLGRHKDRPVAVVAPAQHPQL